MSKLSARVASLESRQQAAPPPPERIHAGMSLIEASRAWSDTLRWLSLNPTTTTTAVSPVLAARAYQSTLTKESN